MFGGLETKRGSTCKGVRNGGRISLEVGFFSRNYLKYTEYLNNTHMSFARIIPEKGPHAGSLLQPAICIKAENRSSVKSHAQNGGDGGHGFMFSK